MSILHKIVSGGQTGVDRAALDVALALGVNAGGWCPDGRLAEDGRIPGRYPVIPLPGAGYRQRTKRNVADSDGTVIIYFGSPSGGTEQTLLCSIQMQKPYLLIDATELSVARASDKLARFIREVGIGVLNVAGPRASGAPEAYSYTYRLLESLLGYRA
ncbi:Putative molybdenum carrier [Thiorhodovibrio winogradskyi]|uniref:Molybdenum carrier n=1 Tax=Thiorhodovibrio winogradskyi TaxID=77007 RepID=A0ABZ0S640_9GAMM|nr:putative molybdenum carrier protein [Thiorhodovibrio winogradskyi]